MAKTCEQDREGYKKASDFVRWLGGDEMRGLSLIGIQEYRRFLEGLKGCDSGELSLLKPQMIENVDTLTKLVKGRFFGCVARPDRIRDEDDAFTVIASRHEGSTGIGILLELSTRAAARLSHSPESALKESGLVVRMVCGSLDAIRDWPNGGDEGLDGTELRLGRDGTVQEYGVRVSGPTCTEITPPTEVWGPDYLRRAMLAQVKLCQMGFFTPDDSSPSGYRLIRGIGSL